MSPPPVPALGDAIMSVARLQWKRILRGRRLRLGLSAVGLVLLAVIAARYAVGEVDPVRVMDEGVRWGYFRLLVFLVPFLFTSDAIAEEVESRTFEYLSSRPVGRFAVTVGKYLAGVGMSLAILGGSMVVMHLGIYLTDASPMIDELPGTARALGAICLLTLCYGAICAFWGAVAPEASGIVSVLYLGVIEFLFSNAPYIFRLVAMNYHAQQLAGLDKGGLMVDTAPDVAPWIAVVAMVVATLMFLWFAVLVVSGSEYRFGKA